MTSEPMMLALEGDVAEALQRWIAAQPDLNLTPADAVAFALRDWLTGLGLLPHHDDPVMAH